MKTKTTKFKKKDPLYQYFVKFSEFDTAEDFSIQYENVELRKDIGKFKAGTVIECVYVNYEIGIVQFLKFEGKMLAEFKLKFKICELVE
jgi:hypothetical protein